MREILFRGKRIDNGEWIEGYFRILPAGTPVIYFTRNEQYFSEPVIRKTVGMYTGLTDMTGKKIFEGDIYTWKDDYGDYHACLICFGEYFDRYAHRYATMANGFFVKTLKGETFNFAGAGYSEIEISGNIHDNPDLLEGE